MRVLVFLLLFSFPTWLTASDGRSQEDLYLEGLGYPYFEYQFEESLITGEPIFFPVLRRFTILDYVNALTKTNFNAYNCSFVRIGCKKFKKTMEIVVLENKVTFRDHYVGCMLGYYAVTQKKEIAEAVPADVLIECYGDVLLPQGTLLRIPIEAFFL